MDRYLEGCKEMSPIAMNEYAEYIYKSDLWDFTTLNHSKKREKDKVKSDKPVFSFLMCVYNDVSLLNSAISF